MKHKIHLLIAATLHSGSLGYALCSCSCNNLIFYTRDDDGRVYYLGDVGSLVRGTEVPHLMFSAPKGIVWL